jgi:hypothetical protein
MKNRYFLTTAFLIISIFGWQAADAQITITIPKIPKIKKPKIETTTTTTTTNSDQTNSNPTTENKPSAPKDKCSESIWLETHLEEIAKRQKEVDGFTPDRGWMTGSFTYDHLLNAVSPSEREKWLKGSNALDYKDCPNLVSAFAALNASAAKQLPLFVANPKAFNFRNPAEEKMIKGILENPARYKIFKIGLNQASWLISKNDFGLPTARYKHGMMWLRDTQSDHPYCYFTYVNVIQDYAGGGTYGASYANFIKDELAGCPAGAK